MGSIQYTDDYATCVETFSTLRIFSHDVEPDEITDLLGIEPTKTFCKGDLQGKTSKLKRKSNGWFFRTEGLINSRDTRRHIDEIIECIRDKKNSIGELFNRGCKIDLMSYYISIGHGGPCLEPYQMKELGELNIHVWWDVYFVNEDEVLSKPDQ